LPIDKSKYITVQAIITIEAHEKFKQIAAKHHRKVSPHIAYLIDKAIEEDEKTTK
jgi:hypothetical protein